MSMGKHNHEDPFYHESCPGCTDGVNWGATIKIPEIKGFTTEAPPKEYFEPSGPTLYLTRDGKLVGK